MKALEALTEQHGQLVEWRHALHSNPELGFKEHDTAEFVARKLAEFGYEVRRGIGCTGVVGRLAVGTGTRSIGLRADMDALPIAEANDFAHRSTRPGRMHACGHDGHTASLLGAASYLARTRNFDGVVNLIFQPAEEGIGGAKAMIADGLFERFPCDSIFGYHNAPSLPVGKFGIMAGPFMAGGAFFDIRVTGKGAHGARPEAGIDPVLTACHIATALQAIISRNVRPIDIAVLSVTKIFAGDAYNVIPAEATLGGTVRAFKPEVLALIERNICRTAAQVAAAFGATAETDFRLIFAPVVNDPDEIVFLEGVTAELAGGENVVRYDEPVMGSEDFSFMLQKVPGAYIHVGNGDAHHLAEIHNPSYDFNDAALPLAAALYVRIVERKLAVT